MKMGGLVEEEGEETDEGLVSHLLFTSPPAKGNSSTSEVVWGRGARGGKQRGGQEGVGSFNIFFPACSRKTF